MPFYELLPKLLNMSLTASVAIIFVLVLRLLLKRAPKVISYALWGVVLIRLLCPVAVRSDLSVFGLVDTPVTQSGAVFSTAEYIPPDIAHTGYPAVTLPLSGASEAVNDHLPQGAEQTVADPLELPIAAATYIWLLGVLCMAIYAAVSYIRLRRRLITASPLRDNIYLADGIASPFVLGLVRPKIYLPSSTEERERPYIILHEQHHIRRLDHVIKALAFAALCVHWFNPLVWLAFILAGKDMEMSCDEAVVSRLGPDILADYTASLLSLATGRRIIAGTPLAFGEGDTRSRIVNLAKWRKPGVWVIVAGALACAVLAVCLLTNPGRNTLSLTLAVPADADGDVVYAPEEISPTGGYITVSCGPGLGDTEISLRTLRATSGAGQVKTAYLTPGMTVKLETEKGGVYKLGARVYNSTGAPALACIEVDGARLRSTSDSGDPLAQYSTDYVGDAPNVSKIAQLLPYPGDYRYSSLELQTSAQPYGITVYLTGGDTVTRGDFQRAAELAFKHIGNLGTISFSIQGAPEPMAVFVRGGAGSESEPAQNVPQLTPGTIYVSHERLYLNPLSSYYDGGSSSGCTYTLGEDSFTVSGSTNVTVPVSQWRWRDFPYTDERWTALFTPESTAPIAHIHDLYTTVLYQPLDSNYFLLLADDDLLIVELREDENQGSYVWSVYSLV